VEASTLPRKTRKNTSDAGIATIANPVSRWYNARYFKVVAKAADNLTGESILKFVMDTINLDNSTLITDEY
jgi:hypothetical protein